MTELLDEKEGVEPTIHDGIPAWTHDPVAPEEDVPIMAWEGSHLTAEKAFETMQAIALHAGGKHATVELFSTIPLPEGVTASDAMECLQQYRAEEKKARDRAIAEKMERAREAAQLLTIRTRLKVAGKALMGKKDPRRREKMAKRSRRHNR